MTNCYHDNTIGSYDVFLILEAKCVLFFDALVHAFVVCLVAVVAVAVMLSMLMTMQAC